MNAPQGRPKARAPLGGGGAKRRFGGNMSAPQGRPKARAPWGEAVRSAASGGS